jgi:hypothetical protein
MVGLSTLLLVGLLSCTLDGAKQSGSPSGAAVPPRPGGQSLVIPEDDPHWATLHGLQDNPHGYGEASWDDVRMRVLGHEAALGRDLARAAAMRGDWTACAERYSRSVGSLRALRLSGSVGPPIEAALVAAAENGATWCQALGQGGTVPIAEGPVSSLRARWVELVLRARAGAAVGVEAMALAADARRVQAPSGLDPDAFEDFESRHRLRVALVQAYADSADPFVPTEPWDYWTADEVRREALGIAAAAEALAGGAVPDPLAPSRLLPPRPPGPPLATELGVLCTGDSLIDTAGFAGPRAIGSLSRLGADDPAHRPWIDATAEEIGHASPAEVPAIVQSRAAELDREPGGIRYYAIKQLRNTATRHLARQGAYLEAAAIVRSALPQHAQDWACPNRAAILTALEGRLLLLAGDPRAESTLLRGLEESASFLQHTAEAEARGPPMAPRGRPG